LRVAVIDNAKLQFEHPVIVVSMLTASHVIKQVCPLVAVHHFFKLDLKNRYTILQENTRVAFTEGCTLSP